MSRHMSGECVVSIQRETLQGVCKPGYTCSGSGDERGGIDKGA